MVVLSVVMLLVVCVFSCVGSLYVCCCCAACVCLCNRIMVLYVQRNVGCVCACLCVLLCCVRLCLCGSVTGLSCCAVCCNVLCDVCVVCVLLVCCVCAFCKKKRIVLWLNVVLFGLMWDCALLFCVSVCLCVCVRLLCGR